MNVGIVADHLARRIRESPIFDSPWPYLCLENALPDDAYHELLQKRDKARLCCSEVRAMRTSDFEAGKRRWRDELPQSELVRIFKSYRLGQALIEKLGFHGSPIVRLACDEPGYSLGVHSDLDVKAGTFQLYLTEQEVEGYGTVLHHPETKEKAIQLPFRPNTALVFRRSDTSFHSVDEVTGPDRWSLIVPYFL